MAKIDSEITIAPDRLQMREVLAQLDGIKNGARRALTTAVNKTANTAAASTRKRMVPLLGLKLKDVKGKIRVAKPERLVAIIRLLDFNIKAIKGKGAPDQSGQYAFSQKGDLHTLPAGWFRQTVPKSQHTAYFVRSESDGSKAPARLPIQELFIQSPKKGWENAPAVADEELRNARAKLHQNILSQVDRLLSRKKAER
jgi:hypothetical protein